MARRSTRNTPQLSQLMIAADTQARPRSSRANATKQAATRRAPSKKSSQYAYSTILFAEPTFLRGIARLLDFSGSLSDYNLALTVGELDAWALASDRRAVLQDYANAHAQVANLIGEAKAG